MKHKKIIIFIVVILGIVILSIPYTLHNKEAVFLFDKEIVFFEKTVKIAFVGDIMLDRYIRKKANENGSYEFILKDLSRYLNKFDAVIANLEGPVTAFPSISHSKDFLESLTFTFEPKSLDLLNNSNIKIVSLDNNHILNFGYDGLTQTEKYLNEENIQYFGMPKDKQLLETKIAGLNFAFIGYSDFNAPSFKETVELIDKAKEKADWIVIFSHWGNEYEIHPTNNQIVLAHSFIDAGADFVIGAHPHVVQKKENYNGGIIYYSLGNFIFDQYFSDDVKCGALISFELSKNSVKNVTEEFIELRNDGKTYISDCKSEVVSI